VISLFRDAHALGRLPRTSACMWTECEGSKLRGDERGKTRSDGSGIITRDNPDGGWQGCPYGGENDTIVIRGERNR